MVCCGMQRIISTLFFALALMVTPVQGQSHHEVVGLVDLINRLGEGNQPTGAGVVVAQVEAGDPTEYIPDTSDTEFAGKSFTLLSGASTIRSHATNVAVNYYGSLTSIAPGINDIYLYTAGFQSGTSGWMADDYLRAKDSATTQPVAPPVGLKVVNHSWYLNNGSTTEKISVLRRMDYVASRDQLIVVNAVNNETATNFPLLSHGYNNLSVGRLGLGHMADDTLAPYDGPGRMKPEIIGDASLLATSYTTATVSGAAALMVETARTDPAVSGNSNAERSDVIKAILLGGTIRDVGWTNNAPTAGPQRGETARPLDAIFGAGLLNVDRSHQIMTAGEQDGASSVPTSSNVSNIGWDLASIEPDSSRYYRFGVNDMVDEVVIAATWHRWIDNSDFENWELPDVDLILWREGDARTLEPLVGDAGIGYFTDGNVVSDSPVDNLEFISVRDLQPGHYVLEVRRDPGLANFATWDVAVTWIMPPTQKPGDFDGDGFVGVSDFFALLQNWGPCPVEPQPCPWDIAPTGGDGTVGVDDFFTLLQGWG
jgi:hypothetical protein